MNSKFLSFFNLSFLFIPLSAIAVYCAWPEPMIFVFACLGIIPLAGLMGKSTECLAEHSGVALGALINATFGNACELIIALCALQAGLIRVVKATIAGSIISNVLLVLGLSILAGGVKYSKQTFNKTAASSQSTLLALAAIGLIVPAVFHMTSTQKPVMETRLALAISIVLFIAYCLGLIFSLKTHKDLYLLPANQDTAPVTEGWSVKKSLLILILATVFVAMLSEWLVNTLEKTAQQLGMSQLFIGVILLAMVGNAAEHSTAVLMALKNKIDLALQIALGSAVQVALFVAPVIVFASNILSKPMDLCFSEMGLVAIVVSVIILFFVLADGECNWLEGVQLLSAYAVLACAFYFT